MPNCKEYQEMTPIERSNYVGELEHSCISDSHLFELGKELIKQAIEKGLFNRVKINPEVKKNYCWEVG